MNTVSHSRASRDLLVEYLERQLCGPVSGPDELLQGPPHQRYLMGILYPRNTDLTVMAAVVEDGWENSSSVGGEEEVDPEPLAGWFAQRAPAAMGVSCLVTGTQTIECQVYAAAYLEKEPLKGKRRPQWQRQALASAEAPEVLRVTYNAQHRESKFLILGDRAELRVIWRPVNSRRLETGYLVTVTLINAATCPEAEPPNAGACLYQPGLKVTPIDGRFGEYPRPERRITDEEQELSLQYHNRITWGIGHGCAAVWDPEGLPPVSISASFVPRYELRPITTDIPETETNPAAREILSLSELIRLSALEPERLTSSLEAFLVGYSTWIESEVNLALQPRHQAARDRIVAKQRLALGRMQEGIALLASNATARKAFHLAQRAMLMQMVHSADPAYARTLKARDGHEYQVPDYNAPAWRSKRWFPFQLAFQLMVLPSLFDAKHPDRDLVDLLWFPTGGGKTEAYLALTAFEAVRRRLMHGEAGAGTSVLMRYTMRLLTSQQFERAAALILALERLRPSHPELGDSPFSIGLWVGSAATPNRFNSNYANSRGAYEHYQDLLSQEEPIHPFQLQRCPWCGTRLTPQRGTGDPADYGMRATTSSFEFYCPSASCPFHERLPIQVVDQALFEHPPTLLLATIDKFARLAWDASGRSFLGCGTTALPPSFIIQDELHLISGPLGSVAGLYEAAMEVAMERYCQTRPKLIAATATIRNAESQIRGLYGRDMAIFPPAGTSADDSYFARLDHDAPGRMYVGIMGQGGSPVAITVATIAALAQGVLDAGMPESDMDTYWTQVVYHNSKRELGATLTRAKDVVDQHLTVMARSKVRKLHTITELSAYVKGPQIPVIMQQLETPYPAPDAIDLLACTNMLSVGVDVSRLGLMVMIGQPKQTAEYIQATSRVGRHANRAPGLVVVHYSGAKPRDRSHYENFQSYHQALYREVEPTSVTPCAPRARDRALHAALVVLMRIAGGLPEEEQAHSFNAQAEGTQVLLKKLIARLAEADRGEEAEIEAQLVHLADVWHSRANDLGRKPLRYQGKSGKQFEKLLRQYGSDSDPSAWPTLNSMRHVDVDVPIRVKGSKRS